jgi:hypothetical protein
MKNENIEKYHFEEIILILLILASDLSDYDENDLVLFSEDIENRIEVLFNKDFLNSLDKKYGLTDSNILHLEELKLYVVNLYESNWIKKLVSLSFETDLIKKNAINILKEMQIQYCEPNKFAEDHLNIEW